MADGAFKDWVTSELSPASSLTGAELFWVSQGGNSKQLDLDTIAAYVGAGATGDVVGPASATTQAVAIYSGTTGKLLKNSVVTIADTTGNIAGVGTLASAAHVITATSAASFAVGRQGSTNPVLAVDASASVVVTGVLLTGAAVGAGFDMTVTSSGSNENLTINAKGSGTITLGNNSTGGIAFSRSITVAGTETITSASASALTVGRQGATDPAFAVDASVASCVTGIVIQAKAAAAGVVVQTTSSGTNEAITIASKGTGAATLTGGSSVSLNVAGGAAVTCSTSQVTFTNLARLATANNCFTFTAIASGTGGNSLTAGSEVLGLYVNLSATQTHGSNTAITLQRDIRFVGSTHAFQTATGTITDAVALSITGAPIAGTNCAITNSSTIHSPGNNVGSGTTNSYGLNITANTGATNNYAAVFLGGAVGVGLAAPAASSLLDVSSTTKGILPPRMTTAQKNAISSPAEGLVVYDTDLHKFCNYDGTAWQSLARVSQTEAGFSFAIDTLANQDYTIILKAPHAGTITETTSQCTSGTATATFKVNTTALGGTANAVSSSLQSQAQASSNTFAAGDLIKVTISSNSSCVGAVFSVKYTRNLQ